MTLQKTIFGKHEPHGVSITKITRKVMKENPKAWDSDDELFIGVLKELGAEWVDRMPQIQRELLVWFIRRVPEIERAARRTRELDRHAKSHPSNLFS